MKMTYQQAYDKIIDAYFKNEIKPFEEQFCFCGTLSHDAYWRNGIGNYPYTKYEYMKMEAALLRTMGSVIYEVRVMGSWKFVDEKTPDYEERLFGGMCAALEVLRKIHKCRGEDIDHKPKLNKRQLCVESQEA